MDIFDYVRQKGMILLKVILKHLNKQNIIVKSKKESYEHYVLRKFKESEE